MTSYNLQNPENSLFAVTEESESAYRGAIMLRLDRTDDRRKQTKRVVVQLRAACASS